MRLQTDIPWTLVLFAILAAAVDFLLDGLLLKWASRPRRASASCSRSPKRRSS